MEWNLIYGKWAKEKINGQVMFDKKLIVKFNKINEYNRRLYLEYHDDFLSDGSKKKKNSYKNYRSKIIDFLINDFIRNKRIKDITQDDLDNYFVTLSSEEKYTTFNSRVNYIKDFFKFHNDKIINTLDFDQYLANKDDLDKDIDNMAIPLNSEQVEHYRQIYSVEPLKLFVFEMIYYTGIKLKDIRLLNYANFNKEKGCFVVKDKEYLVPNHLIPIVEKLKDDKFFNNKRHYHELISRIKEELRANGIIENFKYIDIVKTVEEKTFMKCPECGEKFEGIQENWCLKKYYDCGNMWIVCKKCGGLNE